jgi:predicted nuclease of restriction endonuclease-like RecB superfamily
MAEEMIELFRHLQGKTQGDVYEALRALEGDSTNYRVRRGIAHLLHKNFSTFEVRSPLEPEVLRERVFTVAAQSVPGVERSWRVLDQVAAELSEELGRVLIGEDVRGVLYADLMKNRILTEFDEPQPEALLHRYNLSQVQGVFYRATDIVIHAYRNDPGEYKLLFRYLKLFQLLATIEGDVELGFTLKVDGPASIFRHTTRYGNKLAMMLPALLHVSKWRLDANLQRKTKDGQFISARFTLDSHCGLVTHYPKPRQYDSMLEESFVARWPAYTEWRVEREVELVPVPGSVMIPDFRLVHPDGRAYLLEIVGFWRPEYLRKKAWQVRNAGRDDLILAISENLNLERAGVKAEGLPCKIVWFKNKLTPSVVLKALEA